ncbi:conserved hypothetical protein [Theileria orientalis strain Shintoku]|uniref:Uncharacterized protein n=1 Tax=Theileria orientalis strain Shintoku TaxID=869250 RepID=J4DPJ0_THEOR|nr:conserved hypothetical protein [Theileria orientalis strain Shintoku]PVC49939.1 hypothetical protein MACL_00002606 [Theileria orientalis]BAM40789.1 conserved hypothetical protein [Theileria orientalis strain Shintoku]|eukprot:XP_009691090.1 conserved hypothetical protein [Theileria orientalis strain Shintoku]
MEGRQMGLFFRKGWFTKRIFSTVLLFVVADAFVKYEYGIKVKPDFNSTKWEWWHEKLNRERALRR